MDRLRTTLFKDRNPRPLVWTKNAEQHPRKPQAVFHTPDSGHSHRVPTTENVVPGNKELSNQERDRFTATRSKRSLASTVPSGLR